MSAYTPGPWHVGRKVARMVYARDGLDIICECDSMGENGREVEAANARLIAQAPAMAEFLEDLMHDSQSMHLWVRAQEILDNLEGK
jgi:hypothetical protein